MTDQHQVSTIIATAICDSQNDNPDKVIDPEQGKQLAKCILEALTDAGLLLVPVGKS